MTKTRKINRNHFSVPLAARTKHVKNMVSSCVRLKSIHQTVTNRSFLVTEDPYYCGLSARTPKFEKTTLKKQSKNHIAVPKRMSVAYLQHPVAYVTGYQYASQQLMPPRQHFQMMWQARSMESGLGKEKF